jgi:hypothetical protein
MAQQSKKGKKVMFKFTVDYLGGFNQIGDTFNRVSLCEGSFKKRRDLNGIVNRIVNFGSSDQGACVLICKKIKKRWVVVGQYDIPLYNQ